MQRDVNAAVGATHSESRPAASQPAGGPARWASSFQSTTAKAETGAALAPEATIGGPMLFDLDRGLKCPRHGAALWGRLMGPPQIPASSSRRFSVYVPENVASASTLPASAWRTCAPVNRPSSGKCGSTTAYSVNT